MPVFWCIICAVLTERMLLFNIFPFLKLCILVFLWLALKCSVYFDAVGFCWLTKYNVQFNFIFDRFLEFYRESNNSGCIKFRGRCCEWKEKPKMAPSCSCSILLWWIVNCRKYAIKCLKLIIWSGLNIK